MSPRECRSGFTLVELLVAIAVGGLVMAATYRVLRASQRFYAAQGEILDVQQNVRAVAQILPGELRELDASDGDLLAMSDTAITIKAMRAFAVTCAPASAVAGQVTIRNAQTFGFRAVDPARDSVLVFRDGDTRLAADDRWLRASVAASAAATCSDGTAGTRLTLTGMVGGTAQLGPGGTAGDVGVTVGSPVRTFEVVSYRLYDDGTGTWWFGVRGHTSGSWGATSPIAGPLRPKDGIHFEFRDGNGDVTASRTSVARIVLTVRGLSSAPIAIPGRRAGRYEDSLITLSALRNNARY